MLDEHLELLRFRREEYARFGIKLPRVIVVSGAAGCGKTHAINSAVAKMSNTEKSKLEVRSFPILPDTIPAQLQRYCIASNGVQSLSAKHFSYLGYTLETCAEIDENDDNDAINCQTVLDQFWDYLRALQSSDSIDRLRRMDEDHDEAMDIVFIEEYDDSVEIVLTALAAQGISAKHVDDIAAQFTRAQRLGMIAQSLRLLSPLEPDIPGEASDEQSLYAETARMARLATAKELRCLLDHVIAAASRGVRSPKNLLRLCDFYLPAHLKYTDALSSNPNPKDTLMPFFGEDMIMQELYRFLKVSKTGSVLESAVASQRGALVYGPSGGGKTLLLKHVSRIAEVEFGYRVRWLRAHDILSKYSGESERCLRAVFREARQFCLSPERDGGYLLVVDGIEELAGKRDEMDHSVDFNLVTTFLTELDGVEDLPAHFKLVASSNAPAKIDAAMLRPGRLDKLVLCGYLSDQLARRMIQPVLERCPLEQSAFEEQWSKFTNESQGVTAPLLGSEVEWVLRNCAEKLTGNGKEEHLFAELLLELRSRVKERVYNEQVSGKNADYWHKLFQ